MRHDQRLVITAQAKTYHLVVAVVLDVLVEHDWRTALAAEELGVTSSQLNKLLSADKTVVQQVNAVRQARGLPALRSR